MADFDLYHYTPSLPAAIAFVAVFAITTMWHFKQIYSYKTWYFLAMAIGGNMEMIGYCGRIISHGKPESVMPYAMQSLLILLAPALFAASIYVVLGRLIVAVNGEDLSLIPVRWLTRFFVMGDVISFLLQSAGGGLLTQRKTVNLGNTVVLIGLGVQVAWFGFFAIVAAIFHLRMHRRRVPAQAGWSTLLYVLYFASTLILIRSVFRLIEYAGGRDGTLMQKEMYLYIFDAGLMTGVMAVFNIFHPGRMLAHLMRNKEVHPMESIKA